jgi:hypothetical protein
MPQPRMFDRQGLVNAFTAIGSAALANGTRLELAVYDGAAMMLASNFRFATEDVDIAEIGSPWPAWLTDVVQAIATREGWAEDWLNEAVTFHLSPLADRASDHLEFGSFPLTGAPGLSVPVPTADYLLALKLKAMRILDPVKGPREADDIRGLMAVLGVDTEGAIAILRRYFPRTAEDGAKQRFLLGHMGSGAERSDGDAPRYGR